MRRLAAATLIVGAVNAAPLWAACAHAQAASAFEVVPRPVPQHRSHALAWTVAAAGVGLVSASFPLRDAADRRYSEYLTETNPARIESRWDATTRADRIASASLIGGEALVAGAIWLRFVHRPGTDRIPARTTLLLAPDRCGLAFRF